jgi:hypothetical protein
MNCLRKLIGKLIGKRKESEKEKIEPDFGYLKSILKNIKEERSYYAGGSLCVDNTKYGCVIFNLSGKCFNTSGDFDVELPEDLQRMLFDIYAMVKGETDYFLENFAQAEIRWSLSISSQISSQIVDELNELGLVANGNHKKEVSEVINKHLREFGINEKSKKDYDAVESYKRKIKERYKDDVSDILHHFPNGLYSKDDEGNEFGVNIKIKDLIRHGFELNLKKHS